MKSSLAQRLFGSIGRHFESRKNDLLLIARTGYSFEEWLTWEVFLSCAELGIEKIQSRPTYSSCGAEGCRFLGDLLLRDQEESVLLEVGIVHDGTEDKWLSKLEEDRKKLMQQFATKITTVQLLTMISAVDICTNSDWSTWLNRLTFWSTPSSFQAKFDCNPGSALLRAWICTPVQAVSTSSSYALA